MGYEVVVRTIARNHDEYRGLGFSHLYVHGFLKNVVVNHVGEFAYSKFEDNPYVMPDQVYATASANDIVRETLCAYSSNLDMRIFYDEKSAKHMNQFYVLSCERPKSYFTK